LSSQSRRTRGITSIDGHEAVEGEVLVRFRTALADADKQDVERQIDAEHSRSIAPDVRRIRSRSFDAATLVSFLRAHPLVAYAEPNYIVHANAIPRDPRFPVQWGLRNAGQMINGSSGVSGADIRATWAWDVTIGSRANVTAVIDTGIEYTHQDLAANMWTAPAAFTVTVGGRTITCAAGTHGFNVISETCSPRDDNGHGTHVAGTIGAVGSNITGVTGVNWKASLMALKFLDADGKGTTADAVSAIEFAIQTRKAFAATHGANVRILSNSWSGGAYSRTLLAAINEANNNGMLFVAAAGNDAIDTRLAPVYPGSYNALNVLSVAATTNQDHLATFSNYGRSVQLAAPGVDIQSTTIGNRYRYLSGTSMAAPHVAGAAALLLAKCPLDAAGVKRNLLANVDEIGALTGWVSTGGRLNVNRALRACVAEASMPRPSAPTGVGAAPGPGAGQVTLTWNAVSGAYTFNVKKSKVKGGPYSITGAGLATRKFVSDGITGRRYYFVVSAVNGGGEGANSGEVTALGR
jgi:subtilisin family serine protease